MKTPMSRYHIHDELTAPEGSVPVLRGALATGGQLPNFLGVLAGSPAALRAYARFRSELRHGTLTLPTLERIALAVAEHYHSEPGTAMHSRTARQAGPPARRGRPRARVGLPRRARGGAHALPQGRSSRPSRSRRCTSTRRHARRDGRTSRSSRRSRPPRWRPSPRWSTSRARFRSTGRGRTRAGCGRRDRPRAGGATLARHEPRGSGIRRGPRLPGNPSRRRPSAHLLSLLPRGGRADRPPVDGRDRRRPPRRRPAALQRDLPRRARAQRSAALRADEGARVARRRQARRRPRPAGEGHATS